MRVLLVDDNADCLEMLAMLLRTRGCTAITAPSVRAARAILLAVAVDLVLTDLHMPDENGLQLLQHCRERYPAMPVAITSGAFDNETVLEARQLGAAACIQKPASPRDIERLLMQAKCINSNSSVVDPFHGGCGFSFDCSLGRA